MKTRTILFIFAIALSIISIAVGNQIKNDNKQQKIYLINKSKYGYEYKSISDGAKSAGKQYGVDVQVLAPDYEKDIKTQKILIEEALEGKADGIIIYPIDSLEIMEMLSDIKERGVKVIVVNENTGLESGFDYIGQDFAMLAKEIAYSLDDGVRVLNVYSTVSGADRARKVLKHINEYIDDEISVNAYLNSSSEVLIYPDFIRRHLRTGFDVALCLDETSLLGMAEAGDMLKNKRIIGINSSAKIVEHIDNGYIDDIYIANHFDYGYKAVLKIIGKDEELEDGKDLYRINRSNMFDDDIERLIFPVW